MELSKGITFLYKDFLSYTESELNKLDLNFGQLPFILYIGNHRGCTPADIKENLKLDWGHCHRSLTKLEAGGFILKEENSDRKRSLKLYLTDSGKRAFSVGHEVFNQWDSEISRFVTQEEFESLQVILCKLVKIKGKENERI